MSVFLYILYEALTLFFPIEIKEAYGSYVNAGESGLSQVQARTAMFRLGLNPTVIDIAKFWADNDKSGWLPCLTLLRIIE